MKFNNKVLIRFICILVLLFAIFMVQRSDFAPNIIADKEKVEIMMTIEDMKELVKNHGDFEERLDIDGVLATLVEDPVYEIYPARLKLQGKKDVKIFYREHFDTFFPLIESSKLINEWWGPESAAFEYDLFLKAPYTGDPYRVLVVLTAKNNLLLGERFYISDELAQIFSGSAFDLWENF